jgi:VanZ family protein
MVSFSMRQFLKYWLPVLVWMILIFIGSTDLLSAAHTSRFIGPFLRWFSPDVSEATIAGIQLTVRKLAHLTEYAVLAVLLCRVFRLYRARIFASVFIVAALYAALDEFHQSFVATRTASAWDVTIDCIGALVGLSLYSLFRKREPKIES